MYIRLVTYGLKISDKEAAAVVQKTDVNPLLGNNTAQSYYHNRTSKSLPILQIYIYIVKKS